MKRAIAFTLVLLAAAMVQAPRAAAQETGTANPDLTSSTPPARPAAPAAPAPAPAPGKAILLGEGKGQVILSWDEFVKITGYDPSRKGGQVLTIPWAQVEDLLGVKVPEMTTKTGTLTVDLPWSEFKALLEWSIKRKEEKQEAPPPTDYIITSSTYKGELSSEGAKFTLEAEINVLRLKGWKRVPILPANVALVETKLPEGVFLNSIPNGYELLTDKSGKLPVSLTFSVSVQKSAGILQVNFERIAPGSSVLDLTVDNEKNDKMEVKIAGAQSQVSKPAAAAGKTSVLAAVPSATPVSISWERAIPKVAAAPTKLYADTETLVAVAEGVLLCQETVNYSILHTAVRELKLTVPNPKTVSVLEVVGSSVTDWRVDDKGELLVVFRADMLGPCSLRVTYESKESNQVQVIRAVGVEREKGFVGVIALANVEITPGKVEGATSIDVKQLPGDIISMTKQPILLAFRYVSDKFSIPLTIKKHAEVTVLMTIVDSALFTGMQLNDGRRMTKVIYSVRNNRNQFLRLKMPEGAEIWSAAVSGNTVSPARDEKGNVLIPLIRSSAGGQDLASFPVEIVYVETPAQVAPAKGRIRVDLPGLDVPTMHTMFNCYLPAEGDYTVPEGLFGRKNAFSGPLRPVAEFASMTTDKGAEVQQRDAAKQVAQMQQQMDVRADTEAKAAGAAPIRVRLPIDGKLWKLEKILALPDDKLYFEVQYSGWQAAK